MRLVLLVIFIFYSSSVFAQNSDTTLCECKWTVKINYPKEAEKNKISGTVIVEIDKAENCLLSNPVIVTGLGFGCDEESLRIARQIIAARNRCTIKCGTKNCQKEKIKQRITFEYTPE